MELGRRSTTTRAPLARWHSWFFRGVQGSHPWLLTFRGSQRSDSPRAAAFAARPTVRLVRDAANRGSLTPLGAQGDGARHEDAN